MADSPRQLQKPGGARYCARLQERTARASLSAASTGRPRSGTSSRRKGAPHCFRRRPTSCATCAFSPDGSQLASVAGQRAVYLALARRRWLAAEAVEHGAPGRCCRSRSLRRKDAGVGKRDDDGALDVARGAAGGSSSAGHRTRSRTSRSARTESSFPATAGFGTAPRSSGALAGHPASRSLTGAGDPVFASRRQPGKLVTSSGARMRRSFWSLRLVGHVLAGEPTGPQPADRRSATCLIGSAGRVQPGRTSRRGTRAGDGSMTLWDVRRRRRTAGAPRRRRATAPQRGIQRRR